MVGLACVEVIDRRILAVVRVSWVDADGSNMLALMLGRSEGERSY